MRILFFLLFLIIILNNTKVYEGLDQTCDTYKDDMKNNCNITCKNYNETIKYNDNDFEDTTSGIKKFKEYVIKNVKNIIKNKSDCNKCMHCIIEQTSEQLKEQEKEQEKEKKT